MKPVGHVPGKMKIFVQEIVSEGQKANNSKSDVVFFSRWGTLTYFQDKEGIKKPGAPRLLENYLTVQEFTLDICSGFMGQF